MAEYVDDAEVKYQTWLRLHEFKDSTAMREAFTQHQNDKY